MIDPDQEGPDSNGFEPISSRDLATLEVLKPIAAVIDRVYTAQAVAVKRNEASLRERLRIAAAEAASDWFYQWEVKTKGGGKAVVEGATIHLANDLARMFGNCILDCALAESPTHFYLYAYFVDLETGFMIRRPFRQRKSQQTIKTDRDRSEDIALQIGVSKAQRNVVVNGLRSYANFCFEEAKKSLVEKIGKDLDAWRDRVEEGLQNAQIALPRVEKIVGRPIKEWVARDVAKVIGSMKAVADGMANWDDVFPTSDPAVKPPLAEDAPSAAARPDASSGGAPPKVENIVSGAGATAAAPPVDDTTYRAYALAWIAAEKTWTAIDDRWKKERKLRSECSPNEETLDALADARAKRKAEFEPKPS